SNPPTATINYPLSLHAALPICETYAEVQRANGDSFHSTNCSPQVKDFNRSNLGGLWGDLENLILKQAKTERYCLFAGPLLRNKDQRFNGVDHAGPTRVRIPSA